MRAGVVFGCVAVAFGIAGSVSAADMQSTPAPAPKIFDELRFGGVASVQNGGEHESGVFPEVYALFNPFGYNPTDDWRTQLRHPRLHLGTSVSTTGEATQFYGGFSWTLTFPSKIFVEAGFGGTVHTGNLESGDGPHLGCRALFREYFGTGYNFDSHWSLMAQISHASHANLCDGPNNGMTRAGLLVGYKF